MPQLETNEYPVIIVGAGLSGICAAYYLQQRCPQLPFRIIESRDEIGGTWNLFKYPGIRSDSDMHSFGFEFKPWTDPRGIAPAEAINDYLQETVAEHDIRRHISFGTRVENASWDSETARWSLTLRRGEQSETVQCQFLFSCGGYYRYDQGYCPEFPGADQYRGQLVHPQHWPENLDYAGKRVTIIGSGATAVTLAPTLAAAGAKVTVLQRSPTWIIAQPETNKLTDQIRKWLPRRMAYSINRWRSILIQMLFYQLCKRRPEWGARYLMDGIKRQLGDDKALLQHFRPDYAPWDQRVCLVPDGDFFKAVRNGGVTMVTDHIDSFTDNGIRVKSGQHIDSDIIVTATGLNLEPFGGIPLSVDGRDVVLNDHYVYKGMMLNGVPNAALAVGYTNASWTLKTELIAKYICRLLNHMQQKNFDYCVPVVNDGLEPEPLLDLKSGYITRAADKLPQQGNRWPWRLNQNYILDRLALGFGPLRDDAMSFRRIKSAELANDTATQAS